MYDRRRAICEGYLRELPARVTCEDCLPLLRSRGTSYAQMTIVNPSQRLSSFGRNLLHWLRRALVSSIVSYTVLETVLYLVLSVVPCALARSKHTKYVRPGRRLNSISRIVVDEFLEGSQSCFSPFCYLEALAVGCGLCQEKVGQSNFYPWWVSYLCFKRPISAFTPWTRLLL